MHRIKVDFGFFFYLHTISMHDKIESKFEKKMNWEWENYTTALLKLLKTKLVCIVEYRQNETSKNFINRNWTKDNSRFWKLKFSRYLITFNAQQTWLKESYA